MSTFEPTSKPPNRQDAPISPSSKPSKPSKYPHSASSHRSVFHSYMFTLASIFKDKGVVLMLVIAPIIYGFFYPWPYATEIVNNVPVGVVDMDHSALSELIVRYAKASPRLDVQLYKDATAVKHAMWEQHIAGYMVIPNGLEEQVKSTQPAKVMVLGNGGYLLLNKNIQLGFTQAVGTVSAGIEVKKAVMQGAYLPTAQKNTQAMPLVINPLFNRNEGYGEYVVPAVSILIIQQTLLMGASLLIGFWQEKKCCHTTVRGWIGRILALASLSFIMGCFYYGWVFDIHHYPRGNNITSSLLFMALFCVTVAILGCLFGMVFKKRERGMQILIFSSLPLFFLSGYPWPPEQLPELLQYVRWLIPTTSGIHASVQLNQMGASLSQVMTYLWVLAGLAVIYFVLLLGLARHQAQQQHKN